MWIIVLIVVAVLTYLYIRFFKIPKIKSVVFIDGAPGAGKSLYCVNLSIRLYKRSLRRFRLKKAVLSVLSFVFPSKGFKNAYSRLEEPMLYSNIPLARVKHCRLTIDILLRKVRIPVGSIVLWDETSITVDQFDYKDRAISDALRDFMKLSRHMFNGTIVANSQSTNDLHYSFKSVLTEYFYIHHSTRVGPFTILTMQEMAYAADSSAGSVVNALNSDVEDSMKKVIIWNRYMKDYDSRCYSILTDSLPVYDDWVVLSRKDSLKTKKVLSFKKDRYVVKESEVSK